MRNAVAGGRFVGYQHRLIGRLLIMHRAMHTVLPVGPAGEAEQTKNTDDYGYYENIAFHEIDYPTFIVKLTLYWMIWMGLGLRIVGAASNIA
jgi:hypothetical protein